jgi:hypothetical protein
MKTKAIVGAGLVLAAAVFVFGQSKPAKTKKADPDMVKGPLLRMDLLERNEGLFAGAKRDPFSPGSFGLASYESSMPGAKIPSPPFRPASGLQPGAENAGEEALPEPVVNVRYVGFVQGKEKLLALILFNGQAAAVAAGESLGNIWKVTRITVVEVEIQGPDGATLKFALEGERK